MTSVEWFAQEINKINVSTEARLFINKLKDQAKEMHKEEVKNGYNQGYKDGNEDLGDIWLTNQNVENTNRAEDYFNKTFNK